MIHSKEEGRPAGPVSGAGGRMSGLGPEPLCWARSPLKKRVTKKVKNRHPEPLLCARLRCFQTEGHLILAIASFLSRLGGTRPAHLSQTGASGAGHSRVWGLPLAASWPRDPALSLWEVAVLGVSKYIPRFFEVPPLKERSLNSLPASVGRTPCPAPREQSMGMMACRSESGSFPALLDPSLWGGRCCVVRVPSVGVGWGARAVQWRGPRGRDGGPCQLPEGASMETAPLVSVEPSEDVA